MTVGMQLAHCMHNDALSPVWNAFHEYFIPKKKFLIINDYTWMINSHKYWLAFYDLVL